MKTASSNVDSSRLTSSRRAVDRFRLASEKNPLVIAAFLGGSLATGKADEQSDIDVYLVIKKDEYDKFYLHREGFLESWGGVVWHRDIRNFEGFGFDMIQFVMEDGVDGELAIAHQANFRQSHGGPHVVLVDKIGLLRDVTFPLLAFEEVTSRTELEKSLIDFWMSVRGAGKNWSRGKWSEAAESLANMRKRLRTYARLAYAADSDQRLASTYTTLNPDDLAAGIKIGVILYLEWAPEAAKKIGADYPARLVQAARRRLELALAWKKS